MAKLKKVTLVLPEKLLRDAQAASGEGIAPTVRRGLELVAAGKTYERIRALRGKVSLAIDVDQLREDR